MVVRVKDACPNVICLFGVPCGQFKISRDEMLVMVFVCSSDFSEVLIMSFFSSVDLAVWSVCACDI